MEQRFLQTAFWASFKGAHGWTPHYFSVDTDGKLTPVESPPRGAGAGNALTLVVRSFSAKIAKFSIAYIPMAPELLHGEDKESYIRRLSALAAALKPYIPSNTLCVRYDCPLDFEDLGERDAFATGLNSLSKRLNLSPPLKKAPVAVQPPDTVLLPLDKSEEDLLATMRNKWRYNIRLAQKKGVEVSSFRGTGDGFNAAFEHFYELFETTSKRDGVQFHAKDYYRDLLLRGASDEGGDSPVITLYLAKHEDDYLAGIITLFCKREAVYLYGASGNKKRNLMPAYLLQWTAIQDAKRYGCPVYDFYGMPPTDDPSHPMHGLYLFKTGFGGTIVHRPGSFDVPVRPVMYKAYIVAERMRAFIFKKLVKKLHRR